MTQAQSYLKTLSTDENGHIHYPEEELKNDIAKYAKEHNNDYVKVAAILKSPVFMIEAIHKELILDIQHDNSPQIHIAHYHGSQQFDKGNIVNQTTKPKEELHNLLDEAISYGYNVQIVVTSLAEEYKKRGDVIFFFSQKRFSQS